MAAVTYRAAAMSDAPAITAVFLAARRAMTYLPVFHADAEAIGYLAGVVAEAQVQVAVHDGAVVGFAAVRAGWLEHLNVHPHHQNRGIGTRLIEWAKAVAPTGLDLWVFQRNTGARALYGRHGWRLVALTDGDNEEGQPDAHLRWTAEPDD
jgi:GNAT superfamily N-acetyltransferase